jgi:hypothetical protein
MIRAAAMFVLVCAASLAACATFRAYDGPERPASEVAIVHGDAKLRANMPLALVIRAVDDKPVDLRYSSVAVGPGHHSLIVDCQVGGASGATTRHHVEVDAGGGESYRLQAEMQPGNASCKRVYLERS